MCGDVEIIDDKKTAVSVLLSLKKEALQSLLESLPAIAMPVTHKLENGVYTRSAKIPKGELIIGAEHRKKSVFHVSKGKIVNWDNVHGLRIFNAPFSEVTLPGMQRMGFALEDSEGCNICETEKTDIAEIESEMVMPFKVRSDCAERLIEILNEADRKQIES